MNKKFMKENFKGGEFVKKDEYSWQDIGDFIVNNSTKDLKDEVVYNEELAVTMAYFITDRKAFLDQLNHEFKLIDENFDESVHYVEKEHPEIKEYGHIERLAKFKNRKTQKKG